MTLKHKGKSKWARRIKERGIDVQDDGTRAAIAEQQHLHAQLTRKMNSMKDSDTSSDDVSDDDDDDDFNVSTDDEGRASKLLEKAKEKTLKLLHEDNEVPNSGVLSLPFMVSFLVYLLLYIIICLKSYALLSCESIYRPGDNEKVHNLLLISVY